MSDPKLRPLTADDSEALWRIRNSDAVRAVSHHTEPIPRADHDAWFQRYQKTPSNHCWVVEVAGVVAGYCRIDDGLVSIAIDNAFTGQGLGKLLLQYAVTEAHRFEATVRADIHTGNSASIGLFEKIGFQRTGQDNDFLHLVHHGS